jgi:cation diffusion facilitator CzcD-associated flavoprotein CzcO
MKARAVVLGNGALHKPSLPDIPGREDFEGKLFHSAQWDHDYDLAGKTVAVIGTGASAIQFVPEIAPKVQRLEVFQRTPPWIVPKPDRRMGRREQAVYRRFRPRHWLLRVLIYWVMEVRALGFVVSPRLMKLFERQARKFLEASVPDPALRAKLTPSYAIGCKRILISNDWYAALQRPNVGLVTDGIERITRTGIRTRDGVERRVDAIICGTGFMVADYVHSLNVVGLGGRTLGASVEAREGHHLGTTVRGFPNLFLMMGPNTGLGHNSMVFMIEAQARYALQAIQAIRRRKLRYLDVREPVQRAFTSGIQAKLRGSVWNSGCSSWYVGKDGYNLTVWPYFTFQYWWQTRRLALSDYEMAPAVEAPEPAPLRVPASAPA